MHTYYVINLYMRLTTRPCMITVCQMGGLMYAHHLWSCESSVTGLQQKLLKVTVTAFWMPLMSLCVSDKNKIKCIILSCIIKYVRLNAYSQLKNKLNKKYSTCLKTPPHQNSLCQLSITFPKCCSTHSHHPTALSLHRKPSSYYTMEPFDYSISLTGSNCE